MGHLRCGRAMFVGASRCVCGLWICQSPVVYAFKQLFCHFAGCIVVLQAAPNIWYPRHWFENKSSSFVKKKSLIGKVGKFEKSSWILVIVHEFEKKLVKNEKIREFQKNHKIKKMFTNLWKAHRFEKNFTDFKIH